MDFGAKVAEQLGQAAFEGCVAIFLLDANRELAFADFFANCFEGADDALEFVLAEQARCFE